MSQWTMDKGFRDKWLSALRSGEYEQTECYLATETYQYENNIATEAPAHKGYCCLGVACAVAGVPFNEMVEIGTPAELILELKHHESTDEDSFAIKNIYDKAPILLGSSRPVSIDKDKKVNEIDSSFIDRLVYLNDDKKSSFNEIADYIEGFTEGI